MKITDIIANNKTTISFEMFPPKEWDKIENTKKTVRKMAAENPSFISVTYGAAGTRAGFSGEIANEIKSCGITPLYHLTCLTSTKEKVDNVLSSLQKDGIENVLALRGDIPQDFRFPDKQYFHYASELVKIIKARGNFCIGAACYPEAHPESRSANDDLIRLKEKVSCGVDFLTTQMFFDNNAFFEFKERCSRVGIDVPIIAGIMPITNSSQINRSIELSGCRFPIKFKHIIRRFGDNPASMKQAGVIYALEQIVDLMANGQNNIHIYTMNHSDVAAAIMKGLSDIFNE